MMDVLVDWFGKDFKILEKTDETLIIKVRCNAYAMNCWALQYGPYVEVLEPESLREVIAKDIKCMYDKYK
jgi:predicted DNA-binding transcriptional regulator YafY